MQKFLVVFILTLIGWQVSTAQAVNDSIQTSAPKSSGIFKVLFAGKPGKAFMYSLILPGAGQVYNRSYWKVPVLYAGLGALVYAIHFNSKNYKRFDLAYHQRVDIEQLNIKNNTHIEPIDEFKDKFGTSAAINSYRQYYDKNLQLSYIGIGIVYLLNGIDAFVDRHLQDFDVSKNLSLQYTPNIYSTAGQITLLISF